MRGSIHNDAWCYRNICHPIKRLLLFALWNVWHTRQNGAFISWRTQCSMTAHLLHWKSVETRFCRSRGIGRKTPGGWLLNARGHHLIRVVHMRQSTTRDKKSMHFIPQIPTVYWRRTSSIIVINIINNLRRVVVQNIITLERVRRLTAGRVNVYRKKLYSARFSITKFNVVVRCLGWQCRTIQHGCQLLFAFDGMK